MKVIHTSSAIPEFEYDVVPRVPEHKAALDAIRNWRQLSDLASFAQKRHGYLNADTYFGVTYPDDLDEFDLSQGEFIPDGYVSVDAGYGDPNASPHLILESEYLELLRQYLTINGLAELAGELSRGPRGF